MSNTSVEYAGIVRTDDLVRLARGVRNARQARSLARALASAAGAEAKVSHVDGRGRVHHFVAQPADRASMSRSDGYGVVVSA